MILTWKSPVCLNKVSKQQNQLSSEEASFYKTLTANYAAQFAAQGAILSSLQTAFGPILAGGIGQYGFTPTEDTSLRTSASDAIAQNFSSAQTALNENIASRGGGNAFLPTGATSQLEASLLGSEATQQSTASNQITQAGYAQGRQNFLTAAGVLGNVAQQENPIGYISGANTAGNNAFNAATTIYGEGGGLGSILGGAAGGALGSLIPGIGTVMGSQAGAAIGGAV